MTRVATWPVRALPPMAAAPPRNDRSRKKPYFEGKPLDVRFPASGGPDLGVGVLWAGLGWCLCPPDSSRIAGPFLASPPFAPWSGGSDTVKHPLPSIFFFHRVCTFLVTDATYPSPPGILFLGRDTLGKKSEIAFCSMQIGVDNPCLVDIGPCP